MGEWLEQISPRSAGEGKLLQSLLQSPRNNPLYLSTNSGSIPPRVRVRSLRLWRESQIMLHDAQIITNSSPVKLCPENFPWKLLKFYLIDSEWFTSCPLLAILSISLSPNLDSCPARPFSSLLLRWAKIDHRLILHIINAFDTSSINPWKDVKTWLRLKHNETYEYANWLAMRDHAWQGRSLVLQLLLDNTGSGYVPDIRPKAWSRYRLWLW